MIEITIRLFGASAAGIDIIDVIDAIDAIDAIEAIGLRVERGWCGG